jgi:hypothetical protein
VAPQHERYRSHRAVRVLLEQLAGTRPLVLVLDDFHWADSASVELLGALLGRQPAAAVLTAGGAPPPSKAPVDANSTMDSLQRGREVPPGAVHGNDLGPVDRAGFAFMHDGDRPARQHVLEPIGA